MIEKISVKKKIIYISGIVLFNDVTTILRIYSNIIVFHKRLIIVNLKYVYKSNTSMLLLMINFIKLSIKRRQIVQFINVPVFLIELGRVYNLNNILYEKKFRGYHVKRKN
ncbi:MAG TPA: hypothetical protein V7792_00820 [Candidatus Azoamicus sp. OHIO2]